MHHVDLIQIRGSSNPLDTKPRSLPASFTFRAALGLDRVIATTNAFTRPMAAIATLFSVRTDPFRRAYRRNFNNCVRLTRLTSVHLNCTCPVMQGPARKHKSCRTVLGLTRQSILFARRWMRGSSPRMTVESSGSIRAASPVRFGCTRASTGKILRSIHPLSPSYACCSERSAGCAWTSGT